MRSITKWQKVLKEAADRRFPNNVGGRFDRVASIQEQLNDVKAALEVEKGVRESGDHAHQNPDHRIGCLIVDCLILAEERGANIESELEKVLAWFEKND